MFWKPDGSARTIGGIQTYIINLSRVLSSLGYQPIVVQRSDSVSFEVKDDGIKVIGVVAQKNLSASKLASLLWGRVEHLADFTSDLVIYCTDLVSTPTKYKRTILIQHGISWDIPLDLLPNRSPLRWLSSKFEILGRFRKIFHGLRYSQNYKNSEYQVCVDYNYNNWLRTQIHKSPTGKSWVIPNCVFSDQVNSEYKKSDINLSNPGSIHVLFARRFESYRGSRLMADAAKLVLANTTNISITFAGEGQDLTYLQNEFINEPRVTITNYEADMSLAFHSKFDIAIIPSLASEGTSLSLLEAMAAGCACIATPVGGITNILIDRFNGLFINASSEELANKIIELSTDRQLRDRLKENARRVIAEGPFNFDEWTRRWKNVIEHVAR